MMLYRRIETQNLGDVERARKNREIDAMFAESDATSEEERRRNWGRTPDAVAGQNQMMAMLGGA